MITLSFSTINNCLQENNSHCWINRQLGRKIPETPAMTQGKELQDYIKSHQSDFTELKDFKIGDSGRDEQMKMQILHGKEYLLLGYLDGFSDNAFLEIKTGSKFWSLNQFYKSMQIRMYTDMVDHLNKKVTKVICMTALSDLTLWKMQPPKFYEFDITDEMRSSAIEWINKAIEIYEKGVFQGGLDEFGKCTRYCSYGENCYFKS